MLDVQAHPRSRSPHCAVPNRTGEPASRASPEASRPPPHPIWRSPGVPPLTVVCGAPSSDGDCGLPVVLALQRVPYWTGVSRREPGRTARSRRSARHDGPVDPLHALAHASSGRQAQNSPTRRWRVPHAVQWGPLAAPSMPNTVSRGPQQPSAAGSTSAAGGKRAQRVAQEDEPHQRER